MTCDWIASLLWVLWVARVLDGCFASSGHVCRQAFRMYFVNEPMFEVLVWCFWTTFNFKSFHSVSVPLIAGEDTLPTRPETASQAVTHTSKHALAIHIRIQFIIIKCRSQSAKEDGLLSCHHKQLHIPPLFISRAASHAFDAPIMRHTMDYMRVWFHASD